MKSARIASTTLMDVGINAKSGLEFPSPFHHMSVGRPVIARRV